MSPIDLQYQAIVRKNKKIRYSQLDCIEGIGPVKKKKLLRTFGSLKSIKNSSLEELIQVSGVNIKMAKRIKATLKKLVKKFIQLLTISRIIAGPIIFVLVIFFNILVLLLLYSFLQVLAILWMDI